MTDFKKAAELDDEDAQAYMETAAQAEQISDFTRKQI